MATAAPPPFISVSVTLLDRSVYYFIYGIYDFNTAINEACHRLSRRVAGKNFFLCHCETFIPISLGKIVMEG